jgi:hypothetical protein
MAFAARVSPGASGSLMMLQEGPSGSSGEPGPAVVADAAWWHFADEE